MTLKTNNQESLAEKVRNNALWNAGGFLISVVISFISIPLFIKYLGDQNYGLYILLNSVMAGFGLLNFGVAPATIKFVAESTGRGDYEEANRFINSTLCFNLIIGVAGALIIVLLASILVHDLFRIPENARDMVLICFYWTAIGWFVSQVTQTLRAIPAAFQNFKLLIFGTTLFSALSTILGILVLSWRGTLVNLVQANVAVSFFSVLGWFFLARSAFPNMRINFVILEWKIIKKTLRYGLWHTIGNLGWIAYSSLDKIIIGIFLPPATVGYYNIAVTICSKLHAGLNSIGVILFPLISYLQGKSDSKGIYKYFINGGWIIASMASIGYLPLVLFGKSFLSIWINPIFAEKSSQVFLIVTIAYLIQASSHIRYNFLAGMGKPEWIALGSGISGAVSVFLNITLIPTLGLIGAGFGCFGGIVSGGILLLLIKRCFFPDKNWLEILYGMVGPIIIGLIFLVAYYTLNITININTWLLFALVYAVTMIIVSFLIIIVDIIFFGSDQRLALILKLSKIRG